MQYTNLAWREGLPYSEHFDDIYYSPGTEQNRSGAGEFNHVFFKHNDLPQRWHNSDTPVIAELGLGSTLNCLLTIREWLRYCAGSNQSRTKTLHYIAIERYPLSLESIRLLLSSYEDLAPYCDELLDNYPPAVATTHIRRLFNNRVVIHYKFMDVLQALSSTRLNVDVWYLDGFSPAKNPEMWSQSVFEKIAQNSHSGTSCSTYTSAGFVKRNMQSAGFHVEKVSGYGKKREMLVATLQREEKAAETGDRVFNFKEKPWFRLSSRVKSPAQKATVIGAGIAGLSVAHALVKRGWQVTVIDKHKEVAGEASSNLAAIVYPRLSLNNDIDTGFYLAAYCYALYCLSTLQQQGSSEKFWYDHGLLQLMDKKRLTGILQKYQLNEDFSALFEGELPAFKNDKKQAYMFYKKAGVVIPEKLCAAIRDDCAGNLQLLHSEVSYLSQKGKYWQCFNGSDLIDQSEVLIVATGSQLNRLDLTVDFPVENVRGQMLGLTLQPASRYIDISINDQVYITPAIDGLHYLGGSYSRNDENLLPETKDTLSLLDAVNNVYPQLFVEDSVNKIWTGIRSMSKDRAAIVGAVPDSDFFKQEYSDLCNGNMKNLYKAARCLPGLYVSAAHGSRGFTQSFLCAEIIASQINAEPAVVSDKVLDYLNPSRFIVNNLKRR